MATKIGNIKISPVDMEARTKLDFRAGDTVKVGVKVKEKDKTRIQAFEGLVLARKHGKENGATFTVRRVLDGVGVERIFPLFSPSIDKIEIIKRAKVRQAKLYHIREKAAKAIRREMRNVRMEKVKEEEDVSEVIEVKEVEKKEEVAKEEVNTENK